MLPHPKQWPTRAGKERTRRRRKKQPNNPNKK